MLERVRNEVFVAAADCISFGGRIIMLRGSMLRRARLLTFKKCIFLKAIDIFNVIINKPTQISLYSTLHNNTMYFINDSNDKLIFHLNFI